MSALGRPRQSLNAAEAAFRRIESLAAQQWDDSARRSFDAQIAEPLKTAVRQYTSTLAALDTTVGDCLRLIGN